MLTAWTRAPEHFPKGSSEPFTKNAWHSKPPTLRTNYWLIDADTHYLSNEI